VWSSGDVICVRQTWLGRVWQAHAWYVVSDGADELVLFAPIGAEAWFSGVPIPRDEWTLKRSQFKEHLLLLARPGVGYSTSLIWDAGWTLREWYVNFERPLRPRSPVGFDYVDVALDLVCYPDGRWELLDEDELEDGLESGVLTEEDAAAARADAARLVEEWPFPMGWEDWRPDPGWEPPTLPAGWQTVEDT
jgi:Protein of unknown function (DUF402)